MFLTPNLTEILILTKILPIFILAHWLEKSGLSTKEKRFSFFALLFSSLGDGLLEVPGNFVFGLGGFLVAQILYSFGFSFGAKLHLKRTLPFLVLGVVLMSYLIGFIDPQLRVPVIVYVLVLMTMGWRALSRKVSGPAFLYTAIGGVVFILSDSLIAFSRFAKLPIPLSDLWIMVTYYLAQYTIAKGVVERT